MYLILGLGFPLAAHFNVTLSPSSAVVFAGGKVITGGDHLDDEVVGSAYPGTSSDTVTGAVINQSINQLINQSINQLINQSTNQSISQSVDKISYQGQKCFQFSSPFRNHYLLYNSQLHLRLL